MGIQSLREDALRQLGRRHSVSEARAAFDIARARFARVSFDLIYARQGQGLVDWRAELTEALDMAVDHLSLYQLTIEDGTPFAALRQAGKLRDLPDEDVAVDMFQLTQDLCGQAGMPAYEISNHAVPGAESRHNRIYWTAGDYAGIGPGAHGRLTLDGRRHATETPRAPDQWLTAVEKGQGQEVRQVLTPVDHGQEYLLMGLRLREGIDLTRLEAILGRPIDPAPIDSLADLGKVERSGDTLKATAEGRLVLNAVIAALATAWF
jgi:oxygen-independent coproporphyrinogen-3 oxidase